MMLTADNVVREFKIAQNVIPVLSGISFEVEQGDRVAIMGASGSGKSTLLHNLGGLDRPTSGKVLIGDTDLYGISDGRRASIRASKIGFVFQAYHLLPELDVLENVVLPTMALRSGADHQPATGRAKELLDRVGLGHRLHHLPTELSGGEQQRVALARSLMNDPEIILADEPTGNLDAKTGAQVLDQLFELVQERSQTLIMVTHDERVARRCKRILQLVDGRIS